MSYSGRWGAVAVGVLLVMRGALPVDRPRSDERIEACAAAQDVVDTFKSPSTISAGEDILSGDLRSLTRSANRSGDPEVERLARQARTGISDAFERYRSTGNAKDARAEDAWQVGMTALEDLQRHCGREVPTPSENLNPTSG